MESLRGKSTGPRASVNRQEIFTVAEVGRQPAYLVVSIKPIIEAISSRPDNHAGRHICYAVRRSIRS